MNDKDLRSNIYELFYHSRDCSLIDFLDNSSCDVIFEVNLKTDSFKIIYHVNGKYFVPITGTSSKELYDFVRLHIVHPHDMESFVNLMEPNGFFERLKESKIPNFNFGHFRYKLQNGDFRYIEQCVIAGKENGLSEGVFKLYIFDIHNLMTRHQGIESDDANVISDLRDSLTGLLKRDYFFLEADKAIKNKSDSTWCLIAIDIEHFKFFDEWYGRETGSYLLAKVGLCLLQAEKDINGIAGYFGQDDFFMLAPYDMEKINLLYEKVRDVIISFDLSVGFMPALGIAVIEKGMMAIDAFDRASIAANKAKDDIRNRICLYDTKMQYIAEHEYRTLSEYMKAFKNDEITFYLQPQCRITTGQIVGAESLARWIKKDGTIVPPDQYIPILEKYGFIADLDQKLWEKVCIWLRSWLDQGYQAVPISVNVSRADIFTIDIAKHFIELTEKYNIPHNLIKIEITESVYIETTGLIGDLVKTLRESGFMVLMDDFGSGYSSLNMLSNLKVDAIKLDANFLHIPDADYEKGIHILESVVNMAKQISLPIVVEGVENQEQSDFLEDLGCQYVQGYHYYRPIPVDKFEKVIMDKTKIDNHGFTVKLNEQFRIREFLDTNIYSDSMLNNIIGSVAFYSWREGNHVDIVRFNQQFYESVGVPDFNERLTNIERFLPPEDVPKMFITLKKAMGNRLSGSTEILRFYKTDGTLTSFSIHFYYLGKKEGGERFYGSAHNVSELVDLKQEMDLIANYSDTNMIFVRKINNRWDYRVVSHGLADIFQLTPKQLEEEMNSGRFALRVADKDDLRDFMKYAGEMADSKKDFTKVFLMNTPDGKTCRLKLNFVCVKDEANNVQYILFSELEK